MLVTTHAELLFRGRYAALPDALGTVCIVAVGADARLAGELLFEQGLMNRSRIDYLIGMAGETSAGLANLILLFCSEYPIRMVFRRKLFVAGGAGQGAMDRALECLRINKRGDLIAVAELLDASFGCVAAQAVFPFGCGSGLVCSDGGRTDQEQDERHEQICSRVQQSHDLLLSLIRLSKAPQCVPLYSGSSRVTGNRFMIQRKTRMWSVTMARIMIFSDHGGIIWLQWLG